MPALMATIMMATNGGAPPKAWRWAVRGCGGCGGWFWGVAVLWAPCALGAAHAHTKHKTHKTKQPKVLFCAWAFFCVIFLAAYTSSLTAMLTAAQLKVPINSLVALQRSNLLFGVPGGSSIVSFFT